MTKEQLSSRLCQLAELRNTLRHSRALTDVVVKDGEAARLWFSSALQDETGLASLVTHVGPD